MGVHVPLKRSDMPESFWIDLDRRYEAARSGNPLPGSALNSVKAGTKQAPVAVIASDSRQRTTSAREEKSILRISSLLGED